MSNANVPENKTSSDHGHASASASAAAAEEIIDINALPEMSADDVDSFLLEEDPEFVKSVESIGRDKSLSLEQIVIDDTTAALNAEIDLWRSYRGVRRLLLLMFPWTPHISLRLKIFKFHVIAWVQGILVRCKNLGLYLVTDGRRSLQYFLKLHGKRIGKSIKASLENFKKLTLKVKLILITAVLFFGAALFVGYLSYKGKLLPEEPEMFLTGFANHATESFEYDPDTEVEPYIDNPRMVQNLYLTRKVAVNLKTSPGSGPNPMGAFEFFIEGMTSDVVIELKDREPLVREHLQNVLSSMTFDELDTPEGKHDVCDRIQKDLSKILVTGRVRNVRIKTIVIKP